jgi:betaine-aldehyde dehydrogenase
MGADWRRAGHRRRLLLRADRDRRTAAGRRDARTETFGPVITVQPFTDEDEALRWANGTEYGLASSVWTTNQKRALRMSRAPDFGCVWINRYIRLVAEMPHRGFSTPATAKDLSSYSLEEYTRVKHVMSAIEG